MRTFMQSTTYAKYLVGGQSGTTLDKHKFKLRAIVQNHDPHKLAATIITNETFFSSKIPHLEGDEMFGSCKRQMDLPHGSDNDLH